MAFLGWNLELCKRTMEEHHASHGFTGPCPDKIVVFLHLTDFSLWTQPSMSVTRETITILSTVFPESMGSVVVLNPPAYFTSLYAVVSSLMDARTRSKVLLLPGGADPGSRSDLKLREVIGPEWRTLTGAGQSMVKGWSDRHRRTVDASPGFCIERYWPTVIEREVAAWRRRAETQGAVASSPSQNEVTTNTMLDCDEFKSMGAMKKNSRATASQRLEKNDANIKSSPNTLSETSVISLNGDLAAPLTAGQAVRNADEFAGAFRALRALGHDDCTVCFSFLKQQRRAVVVALHDSRGFGVALDKASLKVQRAEPNGQAAEARVAPGWQLVAVQPFNQAEDTSEVCVSGNDTTSSYAMEENEVPVRVSEDLRIAVAQFKKAGNTHAKLIFSEVATTHSSVVFDLAEPLAMNVHPEKLQVTSVAVNGQAALSGVEPGWRIESVRPCSHQSMTVTDTKTVSIPTTLITNIANVASIIEDDEAMLAVAVEPTTAATSRVAPVDPSEKSLMNLDLGTVAAVACVAVAVASLGTVATVAMIGFLASAAFILDRLRSRPNECSKQVPETTNAPYRKNSAVDATHTEVLDAASNVPDGVAVALLDDKDLIAETISEFDGWRPEWDDTFTEVTSVAVQRNGSERTERTKSDKTRSESELDLLLELWASFEKVRT